jgi:hypothetical protein
MAEVDQVAYRLAGDPQVIEQLRVVLRQKLGDRLQFGNQAAGDQQVGHVTLPQLLAFVRADKFVFGGESDAAEPEFDLQALLVNLFGHPVTAVVEDLERGPHEGVAFGLKNIWWFNGRHVLRGRTRDEPLIFQINSLRESKSGKVGTLILNTIADPLQLIQNSNSPVMARR